jgi:hypothetical protein
LWSRSINSAGQNDLFLIKRVALPHAVRHPIRTVVSTFMHDVCLYTNDTFMPSSCSLLLCDEVPRLTGELVQCSP